MAGRFTVSVQQLDFGREFQIIVIDERNPTRRMTMQLASTDVEDLEEMLQSVIDRLHAAKGKKTMPPVEIRAAFEEAVDDALR